MLQGSPLPVYDCKAFLHLSRAIQSSRPNLLPNSAPAPSNFLFSLFYHLHKTLLGHISSSILRMFLVTICCHTHLHFDTTLRIAYFLFYNPQYSEFLTQLCQKYISEERSMSKDFLVRDHVSAPSERIPVSMDWSEPFCIQGHVFALQYTVESPGNISRTAASIGGNLVYLYLIVS